MSKPLTGVIVGAGNRSLCYAQYAITHPEKLKILAVVDPQDHRRNIALKKFNLTPADGYNTVEELCEKNENKKIADIAINGTMDQLHLSTSLPLLKAGYDILLEKPFAISESEMWQLVEASKKYKRKISICHVLRYSPFYNLIRHKIIEGRLGKILNIQTNEHVSYHHEATAFVRGKWNQKAICGSGHLMAKCCHDLDMIMWLMSGNAPTSVSSFGNQMFFNKENAPKGSGTRCLTDCQIENDCPYSAKKLYLDTKIWEVYAWEDIESHGEVSDEFKLNHLKNGSPYGRCVWRCDNDLVDHQSVMIQFEDGATATHNMISNTGDNQRAIHIIGTKAELFGLFNDNKFEIRTPKPEAENNYEVEKFDTTIKDESDPLNGGGHGGGDMRLIADFVEFIQGQTPSIACTTLEDSILGHLTGFKAEDARENNTIESIVLK